MKDRLARNWRALPIFLAWVTLLSVAILFVWDASPKLFPTRAHDLLGAMPLALIAISYLTYQAVRKPSWPEILKAILLALAFLLWAANQFWPERNVATLCNDLAIGLFVFDVFLVVVGWPSSSPEESFAETYVETGNHKPGRDPQT